MIPDFQLHAFVDQQLASSERADVLCEAGQSARLAARLAELQQLKHLVRYAYRAGDSTHVNGCRDAVNQSKVGET